MRPHTPTLSRCVFVVLDEPGQTKVSDLTHQTFPDQDVGRAQVSVDVVHPLDVRHARSHLGNVVMFYFILNEQCQGELIRAGAIFAM